MKKKKVKKQNLIKVDVKVHDIFKKLLKKMQRYTFAKTYLLGMNKKNIIDTAILIDKDPNLESCENMGSISSGGLANAYIEIMKKNRKVFGMGRISKYIQTYGGYSHIYHGRIIYYLGNQNLSLLTFTDIDIVAEKAIRFKNFGSQTTDPSQAMDPYDYDIKEKKVLIVK